MKKSFHIYIRVILALVSSLNAATLTENLTRDSDGDKISDAVELSLGLNPLDKSDGESDEDQDGLSLSTEINNGSNPIKADTDDDGISDFFELYPPSTPSKDSIKFSSINRPAPLPALSRKIKPAKNLITNSKFSFSTKSKQTNSAKINEQPAQLSSEVSSINGWQPERGSNIEVWQTEDNQFLRIGNGIKQPLKNLVNGNYILKWKHRQSSEDLNQSSYQFKVSTTTGQIVFIKSFKPILTNEWEDVLTQFRVNTLGSNQQLWLSINPVNGNPCTTFIDDIYLLRAGFDVDLNRDGKIEAGEGPKSSTPFYFWINNDTDKEEFGGSDWSTTLTSEADGNDEKINSLRDLIDFFPLNLNFAQAIKAYPPDGQTRYILSQADSAVNVVFTGLNAKIAGSYNQKINSDIYGDNFNQSWPQAKVHHLNPSLELSTEQVTQILNKGELILLIEGRKISNAPIIFTIERSGLKCLEISLPLHLDEVERMYRHLNLRDSVRTYTGDKIPDSPSQYGRPTEIENPAGWPDSQTGKKYLVFVHGFNINAQEARGWNNEMFKRFYSSGSQARFIGVTWRGDTSPDYHEAVYRAFQSGEALAKNLNGFIDGPVTIAAHSLGNAVVSNAIQRGNIYPQSYLALNAAIPAEAYSVECSTLSQKQNMTELAWRKYDSRLYASNWSELFPASDPRSKLTWRNQFNKSQKIISNFYSGGDEIISKANSATDASITKLVLHQGFNFSDNAWKYQELIKGLSWCDSLAALFMSRCQAGWAFNDDWWLWADADEGGKVKYTPNQTRSISNSRLINKPFFEYFSEREIQSNQKNIGLQKASEPKVIYDLLARGIPALTYATGVMSLNDNVKFNFDLELLGRNTANWPNAGHEKPSQKQRWLHCDIKNVAFPIIYPTFKVMVTEGLLK